MSHDLRELIKLWDRADRMCEETGNVLDMLTFRLEISEALLRERSVHLAEIRDLVARSKALLASAARRRAVRPASSFIR